MWTPMGVLPKSFHYTTLKPLHRGCGVAPLQGPVPTVLRGIFPRAYPGIEFPTSMTV